MMGAWAAAGMMDVVRVAVGEGMTKAVVVWGREVENAVRRKRREVWREWWVLGYILAGWMDVSGIRNEWTSLTKVNSLLSAALSYSKREKTQTPANLSSNKELRGSVAPGGGAGLE